jgi:hypothetical protein
MGKYFEVGKEYRDKGSPYKDQDQFLRWFKGPLEKTIANNGGIRRLKSHSPPNKDEATCVVLVSNPKRNHNRQDNPWEDKIDLENGRIEYWGDAKVDEEKKYDEFPGNKLLERIYRQGTVEGKRENVPPILFFEKPRKGYVKFLGLAVIENIEVKRFLQDDQPVSNYLFDLAILDEDRVPVEWIHERTAEDSDSKAPESWKNWVKGKGIDRYTVYRREIRSRKEQLPVNEQEDLIEEINEEFSGREFEFLLKELLNDFGKFKEVEVTPKSRDRGFDLEGYVKVPEIDFSVPFRAEAKRWKSGHVDPKDVSRLASRLETGQFGVFFTTTHFSRQAQEETHSTYPIRLISGRGLASMLLQSSLTNHGRLKDEIVEEVKDQA